MPKYPFSPAVLDAMPEELAELYRNLEQTLLHGICSRLNASGDLNEAAIQHIRALRSHGIDLPDIKKAIVDTSGIGEKKLESILDGVVERNKTYYSQLCSLAKITAPAALVSSRDIDAIRRQTTGAFRNLTGSMGFLVNNGKTLLPPGKAYQWALDNAIFQVQSGAFSYNEAITGAVKQLAQSGLKTVNYESGHIDQLDTAVRRAVMTGVNQVNQRYREQSLEYLGTDLVEVTAHSGARDKDGPMGWENHKKWQGKVYRWAKKSGKSTGKYSDFEKTCGYGSVTGIGGANCRHSWWPFLEGVMERTYTDEELADIDPPPVEYEGRTYSAYEATQKQRQLERSIRRCKREKTAYQAAGLEEEATAANIRLRRLREKYHAFSRAAGLPEQPERMRVLYGNSSHAAGAKGLANSAKRDIMRSTGDGLISITDEAVQRVPLVRPAGWSTEQARKLQEAHRDLLRFVKDAPVGTEAGAIYSMGMLLLSQMIMGDHGENGVILPVFDTPYIVLHNHPDGQIFSHTDVETFLFRSDMEIISIVTNDGNVFLLHKTDDYDGLPVVKLWNSYQPQIEEAMSDGNLEKYIQIINLFLKGAKDYGLQYFRA